MNKSVEDCLIVGVDLSEGDDGSFVVARRKNGELYVVNILNNEEGLEVYNKLIGDNVYYNKQKKGKK